MSNTPQIRFAGFTDAWEQRKCGDVLIERNVQHPQNQEFPLVSFTVENGVTPKTERYEREQLVRGDKSAKKYKETRLNDIVYNPANLKFGAIARNKYGNAVFSPIYVTYEVKEELAFPSFVEMCVTKESFIKNALQYQQGTVYERMAVSTEDFATLDIMLPTLDEQKIIGGFFSELDKIITLHQRKYEALLRFKSAMLQKMFPQNDESVPEIRFAGFTNAWEQRKWCDTVDISTEMVNPTEEQYSDMPHIAPGNIESFTGRVYDNVKTVKEEELISGKFRFRKGDIIYGKIRPQLGKYVFAEYDGLTSADAYVLKAHNALNQKFLFIVLQTKDFYDYSVSVSQRSGMPKINRNELNAYCFTAPNEEEQRKIGEFFLSIDRLITLHQRKLETLQKTKKSLLQKMFV